MLLINNNMANKNHALPYNSVFNVLYEKTIMGNDYLLQLTYLYCIINIVHVKNFFIIIINLSFYLISYEYLWQVQKYINI